MINIEYDLTHIKPENFMQYTFYPCYHCDTVILSLKEALELYPRNRYNWQRIVENNK